MALLINNLTKSYGKKLVFSEINLDISTGVTALLGPNGSGKTTLIRIICKRIKPDSGEISIKNRDGMIGYLPQRFGTVPSLSCMEMLQFFNAYCDKKSSDKEIIDILELVHLKDNIDSKTGTLSTGMLRRLGIAQALLGDPEILLLDEPTANLDIEERQRIKDILLGLKDRKTILISTHITEDITALAGRIVVLHNGKIAFDGTSEQLTDVAKDRDVNGMNVNAEGNRLPTLEDGYLCLLRQRKS